MFIETGDEVARKEVAEGLSRLLADTFGLYLKTHSYHWNVTGSLFPALHALFERQYLELQAAVDPLAERIRAMGHPAPGSFSAFSRLTALPEGQGPSDAIGMVRDLAAGHGIVAQTARDVLVLAEHAGDAVTVDLATSRLEAHQLAAWMLLATAE
ncbi:MAG TPA: Dps family protein [Acidimicrobiia bacterium]